MKTIINDLIAEQSALDALLQTLDEEQWNTVSPEGGWEVRIKDSLAHIAFFDYAAMMLSTGQAGDMTELTSKVTMDEDFLIKEYLDMSGAETLAFWRESRSKLCASMYGKNPKDRVPWAPGLPMSAKSIVSARLMELWAHSVDIYDALGMEPVVRSDNSIASTLFLSWQARPNAYRINGLTMPETPIYLELTLPSGKIWTAGEKNSENYIKGSAREWALVAVRRRNWMDTGLEVVGEAAREYAGIVQTYAGGAESAPKAKNHR